MSDTLDVTLRSVHRMTPNVKQFVLEADDHRFDYRPGQHTAVHFEEEGDEEVVRPYTSTALPGTRRITLAVKRYPDGTASTWLHDREVGDEITIEEVDGNLYLRDLDRDAVFLATGTGLTPMVAMSKQYALEATGSAHLFFGETDEEHLFYRETLDQLAADHPDFEVTYVLSDAGDGWDGPEGHVQDHLDDRLDGFGGRDCYVCGVPEMVVETRDLLVDRGVDDDRIYTEGWEGDEVTEES